MTPAEARRVTQDRLFRWGNHLDRAHATPFLLMGVTGDTSHPSLVICVPEDTSDKELRQMLHGALQLIEDGEHRRADRYERREGGAS